MRSALLRAFALAGVVTLPVGLFAISSQTPSAPMPSPAVRGPVAATTPRTTQNSEVSTLIAQAKEYADQQRVEEALQLLDRAMTSIRAAQAARTPASIAPARGMPLRVGGAVRAPTKTLDVTPRYPADARASGVQGRVILEAVINESGEVSDVRVLRSLPLLDEAAIEAVSQWRYTPSSLDGIAVPVIMTVTVDFALN